MSRQAGVGLAGQWRRGGRGCLMLGVLVMSCRVLLCCAGGALKRLFLIRGDEAIVLLRVSRRLDRSIAGRWRSGSVVCLWFAFFHFFFVVVFSMV
ncbi:hypothetical protein BC567DRAFT_226893 [Phyllosticta citribraziliensis]